MFGLNPYALAAKAGALLAALFVGIWIGHKVTSDAWKADQLAIEQAAVDKYKATAEADAKAAAALETKKEAINVQYRTITRTVEKLVDRPVYRNVCLDDDGLRAVNEALRGPPADPGKPAGPVPAPGAP